MPMYNPVAISMYNPVALGPPNGGVGETPWVTAYDDVLARRVAAGGPAVLAGGSGYFAARGSGLDPALFIAGDRLRPEVRLLVLQTLYGFWSRRYVGAPEWSRVWIAGSGITTAWNATREAGGAPGDLDCMVGVHWPGFFARNAVYRGNSEDVLAAHLNTELHAELWPTVANASINGSHYEVTFYVNPGTDTDIRNINPYAAYDVTGDAWSVHPVEVPHDFGPSYFSSDARDMVAADAARAGALAATFNRLRSELQHLHEGDPHRVNVARALHQTVLEGHDAFHVIHSGRRTAFRPGGRGYFDVANYRWQAGKQSGALTVLRQMAQLHEAAHRDITPCSDDPGHLLMAAAMVNGRSA